MKSACRCLFVILSACVLMAQQSSPTLPIDLQWRLIGPFRGGRSVAVTGVAGDGRTFYFGGVDSGVWKTTDAGMVWTPVFDGQPVGSIGAIAVAPSDPKTIYAGTGESDIRSNLASGDGVYKSSDGGKTWSNVGLKETRQISRVVVSPGDPNTVYVAALGHAYGPNEERGVFRSTDGGQTWQKVLYKGPATGAADLAISTDAPKVLFASLWNAHRPPWSTYAPIPDLSQPQKSGLYRSTDGGATWSEVTGHGLPEAAKAGWGRVGVAIAAGTLGKRVYALIEAEGTERSKSGLYRSDDGGDTWTLANSDPRITSRAWYFSSITADPNEPGAVYIPNVALYKLSDGGKTLSIVRGAPGGDDYHQLWIDPANSLRMVLGVDQGTTVTLDGGETWSSWYNQPTAQFYHVITDNDFPYHVYGAQQDSGTAAIASRTVREEIDSRDWFVVGGSESGYIAPDPKDSNIIYSSGVFGDVARFNRKTGQSQNVAPWPMPGFGVPAPQRKFRDPWTPVLVFSQAAPDTLYLGTQYVMRTRDGGLHWETISPDLTGAAPDAAKQKASTPLAADNARERGYGVVYTIAPSPLSADEIWAGSDTGLIHVSRDAGKKWENVTPPKLGDWSKITHIEVSHFTSGEAYAAVDRHRLDDMRPYLYRTRDFGKTWTPIVSGIADHSFVNAVREDPAKNGLLFAATEFGVYMSLNDGDVWQPLQLNLPVTSTRDLAIHGDDLIVATHGRSFWVLDDIAPLRQLDHQVTTADAYLFKPAPAVRLTSDTFFGTPLPPEEPQARNPARGAYIDYSLQSEAKGDVLLEIIDSLGASVRRFSSADKPPAPPANAPIAPRWFTTKPVQLSGQPGGHRFIWDLRYARTGEVDTGDSDDESERWAGPLVAPGLYRVRLTVNGHTMEEPLQVTMDPRSEATLPELTQQYELGRKVFEDLIKARKALAEGISFEKELVRLQTGAKRKASVQEVKRLSTQTHELLAGRQTNPEQGLRACSVALTAALGAIESADRVPPAQVTALYNETAPTLNSLLTQWRAIKTERVPRLNERLRQERVTPIHIAALERDAEESLAR